LDNGGIITEIIYITPGFIALEFLYFLIPSKRRTGFERLAWSLILTIPILGIIKFIQEITPYLVFDYLPSYVAWAWSLALGLGFLISRIYRGKNLSLKLGGLFGLEVIYNYPRVWNKFFAENNDNTFRFNLDDGRIYIGKIVNYSIDPNYEEQEIFIRPAFVCVEKERKLEGLNYFPSGSYLKLDSIVTVDVLPERIDMSAFKIWTCPECGGPMNVDENRKALTASDYVCPEGHTRIVRHSNGEVCKYEQGTIVGTGEFLEEYPR
jgi:hypothetical protein